MENILTQARLKELLSYDMSTGLFTRRVYTSPRAKVGDTAGLKNGRYVVVRVDGRRYYAHRLAYFYVVGSWPPNDIDHRDLDKANNAWVNLRPATVRQNFFNKACPSNNKLGHKNIRKVRGHMYVVRVAGKHVAYCGDLDAAVAARDAYLAVHAGEFARV